MSSFVHVDQPNSHPGVVRAERFAALLSLPGRLAAGLVGMLAFVAMAWVVFIQWVPEVGTDDVQLARASLLTLIFASFALCAVLIVWASGHLAGAWNEATQRHASAQADSQYLASAAHNPRLLEELQAAFARQEAEHPGDTSVAKAQRKLAAELNAAQARNRFAGSSSIE